MGAHLQMDSSPGFAEDSSQSPSEREHVLQLWVTPAPVRGGAHRRGSVSNPLGEQSCEGGARQPSLMLHLPPRSHVAQQYQQTPAMQLVRVRGGAQRCSCTCVRVGERLTRDVFLRVSPLRALPHTDQWLGLNTWGLANVTLRPFLL